MGHVAECGRERASSAELGAGGGCGWHEALGLHFKTVRKDIKSEAPGGRDWDSRALGEEGDLSLFV